MGFKWGKWEKYEIYYVYLTTIIIYLLFYHINNTNYLKIDIQFNYYWLLQSIINS